MKQKIRHEKRGRGGQPGNQNARTHGKYSLKFSPHEAEVLKAFAGLDTRGQQVVFKHLLNLAISHRLESHSIQPVTEKAERIPRDAEFDRELSAWAKEQNIDLDKFMSDVLKTIHG